jgi:hypothetical protein
VKSQWRKRAPPCNPKEFLAYLRYLEKRGVILLDSIVASDDYYCGLTIPGWQELEPMPQPGGIPCRWRITRPA